MFEVRKKQCVGVPFLSPPPPPPPAQRLFQAVAQHLRAGTAVARHFALPKQTSWRRPWAYARLFLKAPKYPNWKINDNERAGSSLLSQKMGIQQMLH